MLKGAIKRLARGADLAADEAQDAFTSALDGAPSTQVAGLLVALHIKGVTPGELAGGARALRSRMVTAALAQAPWLDTGGTGGDGRGTFNVSTAAAFVAASLGVAVAKQVHPRVSSRCGSEEVLEAAGVRLIASPDQTLQSAQSATLALLPTRVFHPKLARLEEVAGTLGLRTVLPCLVPLANPANASRALRDADDRA